MNNETQRRIKAYKAALPELRERVIAVALLLAMSASMLTSASFAWLTLSLKPEVSGVSTTVAANGNLEIALSDKDGLEPDESAIGDSSANQDVTLANLTWGNLVNLSHESYGLENLALRPAMLNTLSLLKSPLYGAVYGSDGRIEKLNSSFGYATWNLPDGDIPGYFGVPEGDAFGVRAISSTTITSVGGDITFLNMLSAADEKNAAARVEYQSLANNTANMQSLATLMGLYMTARMNSDDASLSNPEVDISDVQNLTNMYKAFLEVYTTEAVAIAATVDLYRFLEHGKAYTPCTVEEILNQTYASQTTGAIQITNLATFLKDRNTIISDIAKLEEIISSGSTTLYWKDSGINGIVNNLVDVGKCTVDGTPISSIGASNAMGYLSGTHEAKITNGILYNFEMRTGGRLSVKGMSITATIKRIGITVPGTVKANISTSADKDYFVADLEKARSANTGNYQDVEMTAEDTYGLAVDIWVRTNAEGSYLTLEGNVITESETVKVTGRNIDGEEVQLYTYSESVTDEDSGESFSVSYDVYPYTAEGETESIWYDYNTHTPTTIPDGVTPVEKVTTVETVVGFEGENRVWDDNTLMSSDATTQGSGSCYVYYADTPEDQARSLKLLEAFKVAFVDAKGDLLTIAEMDTARFYADSGRVIVPLVLPNDSINLGEDYQGNETRAIMPLEKNTPTRITAIVYLDGTKLDNQDVLSAADIQGQLNIQFGSSQDLTPIDDEKLQSDVRTVTAAVSKAEFSYDSGENLTTTVTLTVDGTQPKEIKAFFLRQINSTQGSREKEMTFKQVDGGQWTADYTFNAPGTYVLRAVQLDGVEYALNAESAPKVTVTGFTVTKLSCDQAINRHISVMTAASSYPFTVRLQFASDDVSKMPATVQGRFLRDDGTAVSIEFTYNSTTGEWIGSAAFLTSGEYTLQYLVLDGQYVELAESLHQTASIKLGMRAAVYTTSPHRITYIKDELQDNQKELAMKVKIMDNAGNELPGMANAKLVYNMRGSAIKTMDADLTWDGSYYVGSMQNGGPGIWQFGNVTVGSNTINGATTAPTFTILPPDPPAYVRTTTSDYQYAGNSAATMNVILSNASAASVQARIVDARVANDKGSWVTGTSSEGAEGSNETVFDFTVPDQDDSYYQIAELKIWDVMEVDSNGNSTIIEEDNPMYLDLMDKGIITKMVRNANPVFVGNKSKVFSGNAMLVPYTLDDSDPVTLQFADFEGKPFSASYVTEAKLTVMYDPNTSAEYGGYTNTDGQLTVATAGTIIEIPLSTDDTGSYSVQTGSYEFLYAGKYTTTELTYTIAGQTTTLTLEDNNLPANAPVYEVYSNAPTVSISAITPNGEHKTIGTNDQTTTVTSSINGNTATVYCETTREANGSITTHPTVTLSLNNIGSVDSASLEFTAASGTVYMYTGQSMSGQTNAFAWSAGTNTCRRFIGQYRASGSCRGMTRNGAGTLTSKNTLSLVYAEMTFTVNLDNTITISNPF